jgi:aspartyl/asparaginyl-tRNA synthetase
MIRTSKGVIYDSCPYIDKILKLCDEQKEIIDKILNELEKVREINQELRKNNPDDAQKIVYEEVADILGIRNCNERILIKFFEDLNNEIKDLKSENEDLLSKIEELED